MIFQYGQQCFSEKLAEALLMLYPFLSILCISNSLDITKSEAFTAHNFCLYQNLEYAFSRAYHSDFPKWLD